MRGKKGLTGGKRVEREVEKNSNSHLITRFWLGLSSSIMVAQVTGSRLKSCSQCYENLTSLSMQNFFKSLAPTSVVYFNALMLIRSITLHLKVKTSMSYLNLKTLMVTID